MTIAFEGYHLAQINIAKIRHPPGDPRVAGFIDNLDKINTLGTESPGFVWIYTDESGAAIETKMFEDPELLLNLTVWESVEDLQHFVTNTEHVNFLRRKLEWFDRPPDGLPTLTLWWVRQGELPTPEEAVERVMHLREHGPAPFAFTVKDRFPPEG
jgi:hypothetical protein